jgi:hypothetical protein
MLKYPVITPSRQLSELSVQEAELRLADCCENVHKIFDTAAAMCPNHLFLKPDFQNP